ncbi:2-keto-4-pentenoate hydratase [Dietzia sp. NCCP-2495]|uniref:2-keto-4-pentenoate hydratase n=1 Tax=Dietzia sp. NCCP-2495 TaxID=2934675 RepID=UPI002230EE23|nr:fumarylacetoacetate hydrolase family protein [Dietzia sp. NCCP-2495]
MDQIDQIADELLGAYGSRRTVAPLTERFPGLGLDVAYRVQQRQVDRWVADGDRVVGHKVGLSSRAMQRMVGVDQPDFGHLTQSMIHQEQTPIPHGTFLQPRIEPEIAFVLGEPLKGPGVTTAEAIAAIDFVLPALEIVDSRVSDWKIGIFDTVSDNASSGGVILGSTPVGVRDVDLRLTGCNLYRNGELVATGAGGAVLGSPINSLVWLANTVGPLGTTLEPGHIVLPGSMTSAFDVSPGDVIVADIGGIGTTTAIMGRPQSEGAA